MTALFPRSSRIINSPDPHVELVRDGVLEKVRELKKEAGKDIWLCGGAQLAAGLFSEIDALILKVNPILLGAGIPLFAGDVPLTSLELTDSKVYANGFMLVRYRVRR